MPLLDHFRPPLSERRNWQSFLSMWATGISSALNAQLPIGYFAEPNVLYGIEIDVAAFEGSGALPPPNPWTPPDPSASFPVELTPAVVEIGIFSRSGGPTLAGAVELVSPANKDRSAHREALVNKCTAHLQAGVGVVLADVVTERTADFHGDLLRRLGVADAGPGLPLCASAFRPVERDGETVLDVWREPAALGQPLPTVPLWSRGGFCLPVELEATYERTGSEQRLRGVA